MHTIFKIFCWGLSGLLLYTPIHALSQGNVEAAKISEPDLALISGQKFTLIIDDESYDIYYGIVLGESSQQDYDAKITLMSIVPEKKSLTIDFDNILQTDNVWIRFPNKVISADNEKFGLFVDGIQKGYELSSHGNETRLGFIIKQGTHQVEIIGNNVIPEFSSNVLFVFLLLSCMIAILPNFRMKMS